MKRTILSLFFFSACVFGQSTQGSITRTVTGDATHTVVAVSSVTPGDMVFEVTLITGGMPNPVVLLYRPVRPPAPSVMAIFNVPYITGATRVTIREFAVGESQVFIGGIEK